MAWRPPCCIDATRVRGRRGLARAGGATLAIVWLMLAALLPTSIARADDWFGRDKALHAGFSAGIAGGGYALASVWLESRAARLAVGGGAAVLAGAGKEVLDATGYGDPSLRDFTWDLIGTAAGLAIAWAIDRLLDPRTSSGRDLARTSFAQRPRAGAALALHLDPRLHALSLVVALRATAGP